MRKCIAYSVVFLSLVSGCAADSGEVRLTPDHPADPGAAEAPPQSVGDAASPAATAPASAPAHDHGGGHDHH